MYAQDARNELDLVIMKAIKKLGEAIDAGAWDTAQRLADIVETLMYEKE